MKNPVPSEFYPSQNYPNPFSERTTIELSVAYRTKVKLEVFDSEGRRVTRHLDEEKEAGTYQIEFSAKGGNASNYLGSEVGPSDGIYVYRLQAGDFSATKTILLERA